MSTTDTYKARILSFVEGKDPLAVQHETLKSLAKLLDGTPESKLSERPAPDKWSVAELLAHLADAEVVNTWRYRQMIEHSGCPLAPYDQDVWNKLGNYASRPPAEAMQLFGLLREANLRMFAQLTPQQWECYAIHAERGRLSVRDLVQLIAGHDLNHLEQVRKILT